MCEGGTPGSVNPHTRTSGPGQGLKFGGQWAVSCECLIIRVFGIRCGSWDVGFCSTGRGLAAGFRNGLFRGLLLSERFQIGSSLSLGGYLLYPDRDRAGLLEGLAPCKMQQQTLQGGLQRSGWLRHLGRGVHCLRADGRHLCPRWYLRGQLQPCRVCATRPETDPFFYQFFFSLGFMELRTLGISKAMGGPGLDWKTVGLYAGVQSAAGIAAAICYTLLLLDPRFLAKAPLLSLSHSQAEVRQELQPRPGQGFLLVPCRTLREPQETEKKKHNGKTNSRGRE